MKDQLYGADYVKDEDPRLYHSEKSGRGPLSENWLEEYWREVQGKSQPLPNGKALMCAYKLCRVEFRYWGMQTKIERFIHDVGKPTLTLRELSFLLYFLQLCAKQCLELTDRLGHGRTNGMVYLWKI